MICSVCFAVLLTGPAAAEELCPAVWTKVAAALGTVGSVTGNVDLEGDGCVFDGLVIDLDGQYLPDWHLDRLKLRGAALGWIADGSVLPEGLEIVAEGLRLVFQTGNAQMDWPFAAQSRPNVIDAEASLAWDAAGQELRLEGLSIDFPGANLVQASARATGVDLSTTGAMQSSVTSVALTAFDARITMHGLFGWNVLMALGPGLLPDEGDMDAAAEAIRADLLAVVRDLPEASVSGQSKAALSALIGELPNPSGDLELSVRAEPGMGPGRVGGDAVTAMPATLAEAAALFRAVTVEVDWTHADAP